MKNKLFIKIITISIITISLSFLLSFLIIDNYKNNILNNTANLTNNLISKYPQLETEIIEALNQNNKNFNKDILKKYGIDYDTILTVSNFKNFQKYTIILNLIFILIILTFLLTIYFISYKKELKHKIKLEKYIRSILSDDFSFNFNDYNETNESLEINNIYQLTTKLKKQRDLYFQDKNNLEVVLSDISHQLKTPLTSLFLINEILINDKTSDTSKKSFIIKSNSQLKRIDWLVSSLLKIAKMDSKTINFKKEKVFILALLIDIKNALMINLETKNQELIINATNDIYIINDYNWLKEALYNVIKNAHEHGFISSNINVLVTDNPLYVEIIISNYGVTILKEDLKNLFNRFYKGKDSSASSIGIGLNLTKSILDNNNGMIRVTSNDNITSFIIKLYKNIK